MDLFVCTPVEKNHDCIAGIVLFSKGDDGMRRSNRVGEDDGLK